MIPVRQILLLVGGLLPLPVVLFLCAALGESEALFPYWELWLWLALIALLVEVRCLVGVASSAKGRHLLYLAGLVPGLLLLAAVFLSSIGRIYFESTSMWIALYGLPLSLLIGLVLAVYGIGRIVRERRSAH